MVEDGLEPTPDIITEASRPMGVALCGGERARYEVLHERKMRCDKYDKVHYLEEEYSAEQPRANTEEPTRHKLEF